MIHTSHADRFCGTGVGECVGQHYVIRIIVGAARTEHK